MGHRSSAPSPMVRDAVSAVPSLSDIGHSRADIGTSPPRDADSYVNSHRTPYRTAMGHRSTVPRVPVPSSAPPRGNIGHSPLHDLKSPLRPRTADREPAANETPIGTTPPGEPVTRQHQYRPHGSPARSRIRPLFRSQHANTSPATDRNIASKTNATGSPPRLPPVSRTIDENRIGHRQDSPKLRT